MTGLLGYQVVDEVETGRGSRRAAMRPATPSTSSSIPMPKRRSTASAPCTTWRWRFRPTDEQVRLREELLRRGT